MLGKLKLRLVKFVLLIVIVLFAEVSIAGEILRDVTVKKTGDIIEITAKMGLPFKYVKHFPSKRGKIIQLQISAADKKVTKKFLKRRDTIKSPENDLLKIRDVIYEGNVRGGPYLVLRFPEVVNFTIKPMSVSDEITVLIKLEKRNEPVTKSVEKSKDDGLDQLMRDARVALTNGENGQAILLFTDILKKNNPKYSADAKEYLGLARERNGQLEMARDEYVEYLKIHPKNRRAGTVRQRLMTLQARLGKPKRELKEAKRQAELDNKSFKRVDVFGRISSIYYDAHIKKEDTEFKAQQNLLMNFLDITRRERDQEKEIRYVFSGSHETDLLVRGADMEERLRSLYFDYKNKRNGFEFTLGRQSVNNGGVLGRFDGGLLGFRIKPKVKAFLVAGMPVDFNKNLELQKNKPTFGGRVDFDQVAKNWKGSVYAIQQNVYSLINRRAIGADARYFFNKKIFYSLVDYDVLYQQLNFLTFHYGWQINKKTKIDFHFDKRKSPVMFTSNALLSISSITDEDLAKLGDNLVEEKIKESTTIKKLLDAGVTPEKIRERAEKNTGESTLITTSIRRTIKQGLDLNATLTLSSYEPGENQRNQTDDEDDDYPKDTSFLPAIDGFDYALGGQLIKRDVFVTRGVLLGGLRLTNNENSRRYEVNGNLRFPFKKKLWVNPKLRVMLTENKEKGKRSYRISPKLHLEFKQNKKLSFDGEIGLDYNQSGIEGENYRWVSANAGFRYIF